MTKLGIKGLQDSGFDFFRGLLIKPNPLVLMSKSYKLLEGGDKRQTFESSVLLLGYLSLRYFMTENTCGFVFSFKNPPTKLKLLFHIIIMKIAKFEVFVPNIWLYVRANNFIYYASKRLEFCRDTIDYQLHV